ncbi:MAG: SCP2 sterol-binding domain-containing protein [Betaproteobacteria bacterium]
MNASSATPPSAAIRPAASRSDASRFELPAFVRAVCTRLPAFPPAVACALALTAIAPRVLGRDALAEIDGKAFRIVVRDAGASVAFRLQRTWFAPLTPSAPVDVVFAATAADLLRMATRRIDPDTLFFERRLMIEGDTETGLRLKNLLDAVELPRWLAGL